MGMSSVRTFDTAVLQEALRSPSVALMKLSIEIDRQIRLILGTVGLLARYQSSNPVLAIDLLRSAGGVAVPDELRNSIGDFWAVRNGIVHGGDAGYEGLAVRGIDYGLRILSILASIPRPKRIVRYSDIPLYKDQFCLRQYPDVLGVILESFSAEGANHGLHIHPSTLQYKVGDEVTWEWKLGGSDDGWDETWYRNPAKNNEIELAWSGSLEFRGRPLSSV
jgi:hypothetical protein